MPEDVLPEQLRGRTPQEVKFLLGQMVGSLGTLQQRVQELERGGRAPGVSRPVHDEDDDPKPRKSSKPIEERILEEPEEVIREVVQNLYGPVVQQLQGGVEEVVESASARDFDDWDEVKGEVYEVLREAGAPKTKKNINEAYDLIQGRRLRTSKRIAAAAAHNPDIPSQTPPGPPARDLVGLEKEIFEASGMSREEWDKYGDSGNLDIKVPTGKKREVSNG